MELPSEQAPTSIERERIDLLIFDLDGVITQTARVHAAAWKRVFDDFLTRRDVKAPPFDLDAEYRRYVDGRPRYEGVKTFLHSRGISLPYGQPDDPPGEGTICALGNKKNALFKELLSTEGVKPYEDAARFIRDARARCFKTAVISASKNAKAVLSAGGFTDLFDVIVDGVTSVELGLKGKPAPDIFLEAARRFNVLPNRAAVFEDALPGVEAGKAGGFALVVGVNRSNQEGALRRCGADAIVRRLDDIAFLDSEAPRHAIASFAAIADRIASRPLAVFLDYDGTLTPIVERPDLARLSPEMRHALDELSQLATISIISGRTLENVKELVGLDRVAYAGAHGFDIVGPEGRAVRCEFGEEFIPIVSEAEVQLRAALSNVDGVIIEGKKYALAVHYRLVADENLQRVRQAVDRVARRLLKLKLTSGKKVYEFRPLMGWNKGKAVWWLYEALGLDGSGALPLYIGDDVTDYDAFAAIKDDGVGILVAEAPEGAIAPYYLRDPEDVMAFIRKTIALLRERAS